MQIECLACGVTRVVPGLSRAEIGECQRCGYAGWDYSDELDGTTRRLALEGTFTGSPAPARRPPRRR